MTITVLVAIYGALLSTLSLVIASAAYRSSQKARHPSLLPTTCFRPSDGQHPAELRIAVRNDGGATGEVLDIELNVPGPHTVSLGRHGIQLHGPPLPEQIPPHSVRSWAVAAPAVIRELNNNGWPPQVRAVITTGALDRTWESIHKYTELH